MEKITIIGGGATGTLLAVNLIKNADVNEKAMEINLVECQARFGRGVAYSTVTDFHLLNVPANRMGAFPDQLDDFFNWLNIKHPGYFANDFVPRKLYGEYLRDLFSKTVAGKSANVVVNLLDDEAVDVSIDRGKTQVILKSGKILDSDKIILAFGNFLPPHPHSENKSFVESEKYFRNPWNPEIFNKIESADDVFVIGTGLSAIDAVLSFYHRKHQGKIYLFSTRGLLPAVHEPGFVYPSFYDEINSMTRVTDLLKAVRRHIKLAETQNSNWRAVIDSLRPHTQAIWCNLPVAEKRYFMQHLSRYWNVARHRMPPECAKILDEMQSENKLEVLKGRLKDIEPVTGKFKIEFLSSGEKKDISADAIINCIGSESDFTRLDSPLVKNLLAKCLIQTDSLKMGINALPDGRTLNEFGSVSNRIFTIGTALKGVLWESTAMPEIRAQANKLALFLLNGEKR